MARAICQHTLAVASQGFPTLGHVEKYLLLARISSVRRQQSTFSCVPPIVDDFLHGIPRQCCGENSLNTSKVRAVRSAESALCHFNGKLLAPAGRWSRDPSSGLDEFRSCRRDARKRF